MRNDKILSFLTPLHNKGLERYVFRFSDNHGLKNILLFTHELLFTHFFECYLLVDPLMFYELSLSSPVLLEALCKSITGEIAQLAQNEFLVQYSVAEIDSP